MPFEHIELVLKLELGEAVTGADGAPSHAKLHVNASLNRSANIADSGEPLVPWPKLRTRDHPERELASRLFPRRVGDLLDKAMADCATRGIWLRVVIELPAYNPLAPEVWKWLIETPWERVHLVPVGRSTAQPLALWPHGVRVSIVRTMVQSHSSSRTLRIAPGSTYLHVDATTGGLKATVANLDDTVAKTLPTPATLKEFKERLSNQEEGALAVLHLTGHGRPGRIPVPGSGFVTPDDFAGLLEDTDVRLLLMSVCHSGGGEGTDTEPGGLVAQLDRRKIPVFIGMQETISEDANKEFVNAFFACLSAGTSVDEAVWKGRKALRDRVGDGPHAWSVPVIYASTIARDDPFVWCDDSQSSRTDAHGADIGWAASIRTALDGSDQVVFLDLGALGDIFSVDEAELGVGAEAVRVAPDATAAAAVHGDHLRVSWISQSGGLRPWPPLALSTFTDEPENTRLLAVARKGSRSVQCLLSDSSTTYLIRVWPTAVGRVRVKLVRRVLPKSASAGVLWNEKALLVEVRVESGATSSAFPGLSDIRFVDAAISHESLGVAALGYDHDHALVVHVNGRPGFEVLSSQPATVALVRAVTSRRTTTSMASLATRQNGVTSVRQVPLTDRWTVDDSWR